MFLQLPILTVFSKNLWGYTDGGKKKMLVLLLFKNSFTFLYFCKYIKIFMMILHSKLWGTYLPDTQRYAQGVQNFCGIKDIVILEQKSILYSCTICSSYDSPWVFGKILEDTCTLD